MTIQNIEDKDNETSTTIRHMWQLAGMGQGRWLQIDREILSGLMLSEAGDEDDEDLDDDLDEDEFDEDDDDLDVDTEVEKKEPGSKSNGSDDGGDEGPSSKKKLILIISAVVLLLVIGGVGYFLFAGGDEANQATELKKPVVKGPPIYIEFPKEEVMAVLYDEKGAKHHVVLKVVLLIRDPKIKEDIVNSAAVVISDLLELVESEKYEFIVSYKGKIELRQKMLAQVRKSLPQYSESIEAVLVTKFIMD